MVPLKALLRHDVGVHSAKKELGLAAGFPELVYPLSQMSHERRAPSAMRRHVGVPLHGHVLPFSEEFWNVSVGCSDPKVLVSAPLEQLFFLFGHCKTVMLAHCL